MDDIFQEEMERLQSGGLSEPEKVEKAWKKVYEKLVDINDNLMISSQDLGEAIKGFEFDNLKAFEIPEPKSNKLRSWESCVIASDEDKKKLEVSQKKYVEKHTKALTMIQEAKQTRNEIKRQVEIDVNKDVCLKIINRFKALQKEIGELCNQLDTEFEPVNTPGGIIVKAMTIRNM